MIDNDNIKDLFAKGLQDHQVSVDPALWSSISSSLGAGTAKTGLSILSKTLIGIAASSIVVVSIYLAVQSSATPKAEKQPVQQKTPAPKNDRVSDIQISPQNTLGAPITTTDPAQHQLADQEINNNQIGSNTISDQPHIPESVLASIQEILPSMPPSFQLSGIPKPNASGSLAAPQNTSPAYHTMVQTATNAVNQPRITLPNIFTPNGDDQNETLQINWQQADVQDFSIVVLDAKNNIVYKDNNPRFNWDGKDLGGDKLNRGAYIYFVTAVVNGEKWQQSSGLQIQY